MSDVRIMGNSVQKQVVDGNKGYMMMQGHRKDLTDEELKAMK